MPRYYWYDCQRCNYGAMRYRNVKHCPQCGGDLVREGDAMSKETFKHLIDAQEAIRLWVAAHPDEAIPQFLADELKRAEEAHRKATEKEGDANSS